MTENHCNETPLMDQIILAVALILTAVVIGVVIALQIIQHRDNQTEITQNGYKWVQHWVKEFPQLQSTVKKAVEDDGIIDNAEYISIEKQRNQLENKDIIKDILK